MADTSQQKEQEIAELRKLINLFALNETISLSEKIQTAQRILELIERDTQDKD